MTPLQSESTWTFERRTWPAADVVDACAIRRMGWFDGVAVSPRADLALVRWTDQAETGLIVVGIESERLEQKDATWETFETNWLKGPSFSADGSLIAVILNPSGASNWWGGEEDEDPSPGGEFAIATLVVLDGDLVEVHREPISVAVPPGWLPDAEVSYGRGLVRPPQFEDGAVVVDDPLTGRRSIRVS